MSIRVLIISHMYPRNMDPASGIFIHNQVRHLVEEGCKIKVFAPVPYAPKLLWRKRKWQKYGQIEKSKMLEGVSVYYPRYLRLPGKWFHAYSCYTMYRGLKRFLKPIIDEFNPELIHAYCATPDGYAGLMLKKNYGAFFELILSLQ